MDAKNLPKIVKLLIPAALTSLAVSSLPVTLGYQIDRIIDDIQLSNGRITLAREMVSARRDLELGLRGYALSRDPKYLESYHSAKTAFTQQLLPNYLTTPTLKRLNAEAMSRIGEIDREVAVIVSGVDAKTNPLLLDSRATLNKFKRLVNETVAIEQQFVTIKRGDLRNTLLAVRISEFTGALANVCLLAYLYLLLDREGCKKDDEGDGGDLLLRDGEASAYRDSKEIGSIFTSESRNASR